MKKGLQILGGLIVALVIFASAAQAAVVTVSSSPSNVPPNPILNSTGANLASGAYVQVIRSTDGSTSVPSQTTGLPTSGTDTVVASGTLSAPGTFTRSGVSIPTGNYTYIVAWETWNGTGVPTGNYGISAISPAMTGISYTYKPASFRTDAPVIPAPVPGSLQFSAATYTVAENGGTATITVSRTGGSTGAVGVSYASSNGTATAGSDYTAASGTLSWASGDAASKTFTVTITDDTADEPDETVTLTLSTPTGGASLGSPNPATLTITDNDAVIAPPTSFVIDDIEGTLVPPANYYPMGPNLAANPTITRVTADKHEGANAMNSTYTAIADPANAWRGWGAVLATTQDASAVDTISFWMKGDGSTNAAKIQFKDQDGSNFGVADASAVPLSDTTWREYRVLKSSISTRIGATGDATMDWSKVTQYQIIFSGTSASTGVLIDYVSASTGGINPQIISITPASGPVGTTITITGANLDVAGTVQFITEGVVTAVSSTATDTPISAWSANSITMRVPSLGAGNKDVKVIRASDLRESNASSFEVTATAAPADNATNAYPNPFNPLGGETTKIVFSPGSATKADIYIFDMTAKLAQKLSWPTTGTTRPDGRVEVTWDGKNSYGEIVGDGVYLYRVVDGGVRKGKILVVNKK
ncbi:MAG: Calx-beta domain-containing protein [Candidatus Margulisiibacteriota bacterium]